MTHAEFLKLATDYNLTHISRQLLSTTIPGLRALEEGLREAQADDKTFLGGRPVPVPRQWPSYKETPLTFVAQVDTRSLPPNVCPTSLPEGILQFFVPSTSQANDYEPSMDCGRVLFVPSAESQPIYDDESTAPEDSTPTTKQSIGSVPLRARVAQFFGIASHNLVLGGAESHGKLFPKRTFEWEVFPTLYGSAPDPESLWLPENSDQFEFNHEADWDSYFEFRRAVMACPQWNWQVQMFGFANELQEEMQPLVDTASGCRSVNEFREWVLLFALNSACGGLAPEAVCYYFWIHRDDLESANFEDVWICVQQD